MPRLKVYVDPAICTGEALCTGICPQYYELVTNREGEHKALVKSQGGLHEQAIIEVDDDDYDVVLEGAERCPPKAIFIWELTPQGTEEPLCP